MKTKCAAGLCVILPFVAGVRASAAETNQGPAHTIAALRQQIGDQQQAVAALEAEVAGLLRELRSGKQELQPAGAAAGGLSLEISFPQPGAPGIQAEVAEAAKRAAEQEAVAGPIPVMVVKPSSVAEVENAMMQVMEQEAAMTGQKAAEVNTPMVMKTKSPEQQMNEAIEAIDKLEAEKTHFKYDLENLQRNYAA